MPEASIEAAGDQARHCVCFLDGLSRAVRGRSDADCHVSAVRNIGATDCSRSCRGCSGVTSIEYALLASLVFLAIITGVGLASDQVRSMYDSIAAAFPP